MFMLLFICGSHSGGGGGGDGGDGAAPKKIVPHVWQLLMTDLRLEDAPPPQPAPSLPSPAVSPSTLSAPNDRIQYLAATARLCML